MGGFLSTKNSLKFGNAEGTEDTSQVKQIQSNQGPIGGNQPSNNIVEFGNAKGKTVEQQQTNTGKIGDDVNCNIDKSGNRSDSHSGEAGLLVDKGHSFGYTGPGGRDKGKITIDLNPAKGNR